MDRIQILRDKIAGLYAEKRATRADWADWIYDAHVLPVGAMARKIAETHGGNFELAEAAGLLHDVADAVMKREDPEHAERSHQIARELLKESGYTDDEIAIVVDDAIAKHSCHGDVRPSTLEGKAVAAGDGVVHLTTDFYEVAEKRRSAFQTPEQIRVWVLPKIERDFCSKIAYDDIRESVRADYERIKAHFESLSQ